MKLPALRAPTERPLDRARRELDEERRAHVRTRHVLRATLDGPLALHAALQEALLRAERPQRAQLSALTQLQVGEIARLLALRASTLATYLLRFILGETITPAEVTQQAARDLTFALGA